MKWLDLWPPFAKGRLYSDDGALLCVLHPDYGWCVVADETPVAVADGVEMRPLRRTFIEGERAWAGGGWLLRFSLAHGTWILWRADASSLAVPTAHQDWETDEWVGDEWWEGTVPAHCGAPATFSPAGELLNGDDPPDKTVELRLPRWQWVSDGASEAPAGTYEGRDGCAGRTFVGAPAWSEAGSGAVWSRSGEGDAARLLREGDGEASSARADFDGPGRGWGIERGGVLYFSPSFPSGAGGATFSPWVRDEDSGRWVPASGAAPIVLAYAGRTMAARPARAWATEVMLWR